MEKKIRVAIADDHELMRRGLREVLREYSEFEVVGEAANADEALELVRTQNPDVILVDVNMPGDGMDAVQRIRTLNSNVKIVVLTIYDSLANVQTAMKNGAFGYVLKGVGGNELVSALRSVHDGQKHVSPELGARLLSNTSDDPHLLPKEIASIAPQISTLTEREEQILDLIGIGQNNLEIAGKLNLSEATIKHYITPLFRKLRVKNRTEAALKIRDFTK